jgi:hypothetical protein
LHLASIERRHVSAWGGKFQRVATLTT